MEDKYNIKDGYYSLDNHPYLGSNLGLLLS